jgi:pyruvate dehydrogenase E1 component
VSSCGNGSATAHRPAWTPEGGAHQSMITPSIGLELPNVTFCEPAYAAAVDWLVCDALGRIASGPS